MEMLGGSDALSIMLVGMPGCRQMAKDEFSQLTAQVLFHSC